MTLQNSEPAVHEDEINLYDLWNNIMKRKKAILWIFTISIVSTGIISLLMPNIYRGEVGVRIPPKKLISAEVGIRIQPKELISAKELFGIIGNLDRERIATVFPQYFDSIKSVRLTQIPGSDDKFKIIFELSQKAYFEEVVKIFIQYLNGIPLIARAVEESREILRKRLEEIDIVMSKSKEDAEGFQKMFLKEKLNPVGFNPVQFNRMLSDLEVEKIILNQSIQNLTGFEIVTRPIIFKKPVRPRPILYLAIAGVTSLIVGVFLAMFLIYLEKIKR